MKIMIVSDSHGQMENITRAIGLEKPLDMLFHCGDTEGTEGDIGLLAECPMYCVRGNNDFFTDMAKEHELTICGKKMMITHGHYYHVSMGETRLAEEGVARGIDYIFYGHTHRPVIENIDGVNIINPGSIAYPRQFDRDYTYMIMDIEDGKEPIITLKKL